MPTGTAGGDVDLLHRAQFVFGHVHLFQKDAAGIQRDPAQRGVPHGARLLINFLEHKVLEAAFFRHDRVPGHVLDFAHHRLAVKIHELHAGSGNHRQIAILQEKEIARMVQNRRYVRRDKIFVVAQADHRRRAVARGHNLIGLVF